MKHPFIHPRKRYNSKSFEEISYTINKTNNVLKVLKKVWGIVALQPLKITHCVGIYLSYKTTSQKQMALYKKFTKFLASLKMAIF